MISTLNHQRFGSTDRDSQSLRNDRCQNILYKAVFEHFKNTRNIAALLLTSKFFQNSSFGPNLVVNFIIGKDTILLDSVLSPSSCYSLQFAPSVHIKQWDSDSETVHRRIFNFVGELVNTKYLHSSLRSLTLDSVTNEVLSCFFGSSSNNAWPQLQHLSLDECELNDPALEIISQKALQLRTVNFSGNSGITDAGLEHISKLSGINSLNLSVCYLVTDVGVEHLSQLSNITSLDLASCFKITDASLERISKLSGITSLNLTRCNKITDTGLELLSNLSCITSLELSFCRLITDVGVEHIAKLSDIIDIDLSHCDKITDAGLEHLSNLVRITSLNLGGCNVITDVGLEHVAKLSGITSLGLDSCSKITNVGLEHIYKLPKITSLFLLWCDNITTEAKKKFKTAFPNCMITS